MKKFEFGLIGLGVMGRNFILNIAEKSHSVLGFDLNGKKVNLLNKDAKELDVHGVNSIEEFVSGLSTPRKIMILVPADAVDTVLEELTPLIDKNDLVIDAGNSHPEDTERREGFMTKKGYKYLGVGISGGAEGARHGSSIMPGGNHDSYHQVENIFTDAAAQVNEDPCVTWLGKRSSGHFVKMVHNGIEYGMMQLISEAYDIMRNGMAMENSEMQSVFETWKNGPLGSYLIEITANILGKEDSETGGYLLDQILDRAKQKGTGKWTSQMAMDLQVPVPTIDTAVSMRHLSAFKTERQKAGLILKGPKSYINNDKKEMIEMIEKALHFCMLVTYAQGFELLRIASQQHNFGLHLSDVAKIWRGGCIIRASILEHIMNTYQEHPKLPNLLFDHELSSLVNKNHPHLRNVIMRSAQTGIPVPGMMSALAYFDALRSGHLAANMIQAQRDYFGSHKYQKIGKEGVFHTDW